MNGINQNASERRGIEWHLTSWKIADTRKATKTATPCIRNQGPLTNNKLHDEKQTVNSNATHQ